MAGTVATPSYGSAVVNGQLVGMQTASAYAPANYGTGLNAIPAVAPMNIPPSASYPVVSSQAAATGANGTTQRGTGSSGIWESPALYAVVFLVVGFLILRHVHWRKG